MSAASGRRSIDWPSTGPDDPLHRRKHAAALRRARAFCLEGDGCAEKISRGHMPVFTCRGRNFAMVARSQNRPSLWIAAAPGAQAVLVPAEPERYYVPPYVGGRGWIGAWLDVDVDWAALEQLLVDAQGIASARR